ncbi:MAG: hypothetical protein HQL32_00020 [Planctomycetes bacterium]|nr:hypothetical protein [Planctomycetota bacterium]
MSHIRQLLESKELTELSDAIKLHVDRYGEALNFEDPSMKKKEMGVFRRKLDADFWKVLEQITLKAMQRENFSFSKSEMLLINFGLMDSKLLLNNESSENEEENIDEDELLEKTEKKLARFLQPSSYAGDPIYYLTEWIMGWELNSELFGENNEKKAGQASSPDEWIDDKKAQNYANMRLNIYRKLIAALKSLPGVNMALLKSILLGEFDRNVELASVAVRINPKDATIPQRRIVAMHQTLLAQMKASLTDPEQKKLVFLLEKINESLIQRRISLNELETKIEHKKKKKFSSSKEKLISNEITLLKNLLPIGGMEGREFFTSPLLTEMKNPLNKTFVGDTLKLIRQCDPHLPENLPVVIVPYKGSGFFEWDKNTLIVPVTPSISPADTIIRAAANYRILTDNLENRGELKRQYERHLEKGKFKERFLADYSLWVNNVSKGHRKIMSTRKFDFFSEYIGPPPEKLFCDAETLHLSNYQLRKRAQAILASPRIQQDDYFNLATSFWILDDKVRALRYMDLAMSSGRPSPKIMMASGLIYKGLKDRAQAIKSFKSCLRYFKDTLFGAYAARELEKKI